MSEPARIFLRDSGRHPFKDYPHACGVTEVYYSIRFLIARGRIGSQKSDVLPRLKIVGFFLDST